MSLVGESGYCKIIVYNQIFWTKFYLTGQPVVSWEFKYLYLLDTQLMSIFKKQTGMRQSTYKIKDVSTLIN